MRRSRVLEPSPVEVPLYCLKHGRRLKEVVVRARREALGEVVEVLHSHGLASLVVSREDDGVTLMGFIEEDDPCDVEGALSGVSGVLEVRVLSTPLMEMGLGLDAAFFPPRLWGSWCIMLLAPALMKALYDLRERAGGITDLFLYNMGYHYGRRAAERLLERIGLRPRSPLTVKLVAEAFCGIASTSGWARLEVVHVDLARMEASFKASMCWEADTYREAYGASDRPVCHMTRGAIAGVVSTVMGGEFTCIEVRCRAQGDCCCHFMTWRTR